jgi:phospholipid-binding lipoprotein MlaA
MTRRKPFLLLLFLIASLALAGCASGKKSSRCDTSGPLSAQQSSTPAAETPASEDDGGFEDPFASEEENSEEYTNDIHDPIEPLNRVFFAFNDKFYFYVAKPVAKGWRKVMPEKARIGLGNVITNFMMPIRLVNNILQLDILGAGEEITRFLANSTVGLAGWFDLAAENGLPLDEEDFGQTLGEYGVGHGFYLVVPFLGPSSLRDTLGDSMDFYLHPFNYTIVEGNPTEEIIGLKAAKIENTLSLDKDTYEKVVKESIDPYLFMRNAYFQLRESCQKK